MVLGAVLGGLVLMGVMVLGLTKMGGGEQGLLDISVDELVDGSGWMTEKGDVKVTVVEFSDLQCSACKQVEPVVKALKEMEEVRFVFRHFPLVTIHKNAWQAALVAEAAKELDKGWEMIDKLFDKQSEWAESSGFDELAFGYAEELGLPREEFEERYKAKNGEDQVVKDNALASKLRLGGTPTFFVEGEQVASSFVLTKVKEVLKNN